MKLKRHAINFSKYTFIGIIVTLITYLFSIVFIDIFSFNAFIISSTVAIFVFFFKYFSYIKIRLIKRRFKIYLIISLNSVILYTILVTFFVNYLLIPAYICVPIVEVILFISRFVALNLTRIIED